MTLAIRALPRPLLTTGMLLVWLTLPGCFLARETVNEPILVDAVASLRPGYSSAKDVVQSLGAPNDVIQLGRRSAYRYDHTSGKRTGFLLLVIGLFGEDLRQDRVWLFFDENDVLSHVGSTFASHRTQYALPWEDIHEESDNLSKDEDRPALSR